MRVMVTPEAAASAKDVRGVAAADLEGFHAVIHLAAVSNDPIGDLNPACTYEINHRASVRLGEYAKQAGVTRFGPDARNTGSASRSCRRPTERVCGANRPAGLGRLRSFFEQNTIAADDVVGARGQRIARIRRLMEQGRLDSQLRWRPAPLQPRLGFAKTFRL